MILFDVMCNTKTSSLEYGQSNIKISGQFYLVN